MANFIRSKLGKRRSRTSMGTSGSGAIEDEEEDATYRDFGSSAHYTRKPVAVMSSTGTEDSLPKSKANQIGSNQSPQHSDSTVSDESENLTVEDYTQPVDAIVPGLSLPVSNPTVPAVPTPSDEDYTEPYEVKKAVEEFDCKQGNSIEPLSKKSHAMIQNGSIGSKKSHSPKKANVKSTPKHSPIVEEDSADNYDKLVSPVLPMEPPTSNRYGKSYNFGSPVVSQANEVTYQAPWDKGDAVREFEKKFQATSPTTSPLHATNGNVEFLSDGVNSTVSGMDSAVTYCQPWDLGSTKQQFKNSVEKAASKDKKLITQKSVDIPHTRHAIKKQTSHLGIAESKSCDTTVYDAPWDNAEKQKELAERLKAAQITPPKRADGTELVYEEPWDVGTRGKAISDMLNNSGENKSPSKRSPSNKDSRAKPRTSSQLELGGAKAWSAIGEPIDPTLPLEKQTWYHGTIGRIEAECMLRVCKEGSYLVRDSESTKRSFSLSMKSAKGFIHIKIESDDIQRFILGENSQPFDCIPAMIYHYSRNLLPIKGADHMILLHPVVNELL